MIIGSTVEIKGLDSLIKRFGAADPKLKRALIQSIKESAQPVLKRARSNAERIADDGTYMSSLSIASRKGGTEYVLKSTDVAAGVKEFAKPGATRMVGKSSKSSTQRARRRAGMAVAPTIRFVRVGVPRRANPPRVMVRAVVDSRGEIVENVTQAMAKALDEVANG